MSAERERRSSLDSATPGQLSEAYQMPNRSFGPMEEELPAPHTRVNEAWTTYDVFFQAVNTMVGTGIFTAPPLVLALVGDRWIAIVLWLIGFVYSLIGYA